MMRRHSGGGRAGEAKSINGLWALFFPSTSAQRISLQGETPCASLLTSTGLCWLEWPRHGEHALGGSAAAAFPSRQGSSRQCLGRVRVRVWCSPGQKVRSCTLLGVSVRRLLGDGVRGEQGRQRGGLPVVSSARGWRGSGESGLCRREAGRQTSSGKKTMTSSLPRRPERL